MLRRSSIVEDSRARFGGVRGENAGAVASPRYRPSRERSTWPQSPGSLASRPGETGGGAGGLDLTNVRASSNGGCARRTEGRDNRRREGTMKPEQGKMKLEQMNLSNFAEPVDRREAVQLDGLAQKLQEVGLAVAEAAMALRSLPAVRAGSVLEAESRSQRDAMQQELAEIKGWLADLATRVH